MVTAPRIGRRGEDLRQQSAGVADVSYHVGGILYQAITNEVEASRNVRRAERVEDPT